MTLTEKKAKFEWYETCQKIFNVINDRITSAQVLTLTWSGEGSMVSMFMYLLTIKVFNMFLHRDNLIFVR